MTTQPVDGFSTSDGVITRTIDALRVYHRLRHEDVAHAIGMTPATWYRRFAIGEWKAREVAAVAHYFGRPVGELYDGSVDLAHSVITASDGRPFRPGPKGPTRRSSSGYGLVFQHSGAGTILAQPAAA